MNVGLQGAITMHAIFHQLVSHFVPVNVDVKTAIAKRLTSVISSSSVLDVSVSCRDCLLLNSYNPPFVGITSKLLLHQRTDLFSNNGPTQQYIYDYDMT